MTGSRYVPVLGRHMTRSDLVETVRKLRDELLLARSSHESALAVLCKFVNREDERHKALDRRVAAVEATLSGRADDRPPTEPMRDAIQKMASWIGDHWARKDWGIEGEKVHEAMDLLDGIAALAGFDISEGSLVKPAAARTGSATEAGS